MFARLPIAAPWPLHRSSFHFRQAFSDEDFDSHDGQVSEVERLTAVAERSSSTVNEDGNNVGNEEDRTAAAEFQAMR